MERNSIVRGMSRSEATSHSAAPPPLPRLRHRPRVSLLVLAAAQEHLALKQPNKKSHWEARSERERKRCERMCEG